MLVSYSHLVLVFSFLRVIAGYVNKCTSPLINFYTTLDGSYKKECSCDITGRADLIFMCDGDGCWKCYSDYILEIDGKTDLVLKPFIHKSKLRQGLAGIVKIFNEAAGSLLEDEEGDMTMLLCEDISKEKIPLSGCSEITVEPLKYLIKDPKVYIHNTIVTSLKILLTAGHPEIALKTVVKISEDGITKLFGYLFAARNFVETVNFFYTDSLMFKATLNIPLRNLLIESLSQAILEASGLNGVDFTQVNQKSDGLEAWDRVFRWSEKLNGEFGDYFKVLSSKLKKPDETNGLSTIKLVEDDLKKMQIIKDGYLYTKNSVIDTSLLVKRSLVFKLIMSFEMVYSQLQIDSTNEDISGTQCDLYCAAEDFASNELGVLNSQMSLEQYNNWFSGKLVIFDSKLQDAKIPFQSYLNFVSSGSFSGNKIVNKDLKRTNLSEGTKFRKGEKTKIKSSYL